MIVISLYHEFCPWCTHHTVTIDIYDDCLYSASTPARTPHYSEVCACGYQNGTPVDLEGSPNENHHTR